jgi:hypothetical protein
MGTFAASRSDASGQAAALKALELDPNMAEGHTSLGIVKLTYEWDFPGAEEEFKRPIVLNPNYATTHHFCSILLGVLNRPGLIMPFSKDRDRWLETKAFDTHSGKQYSIALLDPSGRTKKVEVKCYGKIMGAYREHPEAKFLGPDGKRAIASHVGF